MSKLSFPKLVFSLVILLVALSLVYLMLGEQNIALPDLFSSSLVLQLRLPRLLSLLVVACLLATSGLLIQTMTGNPIAEMTTLGISGGSSLFLSLLIFLGFSTNAFIAVCFSVLGAFLSLLLLIVLNARTKFRPIKVILSGTSLGLFMSSLASSLSFAHNDSQSYLRWVVGGFSGITWQKTEFLFIFLPVFFFFVLLYAKPISMLAVGEELAESLGVPVQKTRLLIIFLVAMATGISVAMVGVISFVGLIAPHLARRFERSSFIELLILSNIMSMLLLTVSDLLARRLFAPYEFPTGALTMIIGAIFFMYLVLRQAEQLPALLEEK